MDCPDPGGCPSPNLLSWMRRATDTVVSLHCEFEVSTDKKPDRFKESLKNLLNCSDLLSDLRGATKMRSRWHRSQSSAEVNDANTEKAGSWSCKVIICNSCEVWPFGIKVDKFSR